MFTIANSWHFRLSRASRLVEKLLRFKFCTISAIATVIPIIQLTSHLISSRLVSVSTHEQEITLDSCPVGDWGITHIANDVMPNLTSLDLADSELTDLGMASLSKFTKLTKLSLFYCGVTSHGLRHIAQMVNLTSLNLDSREIGDDGVAHLKNLKKLEVRSSVSSTNHGTRRDATTTLRSYSRS